MISVYSLTLARVAQQIQQQQQPETASAGGPDEE